MYMYICLFVFEDLSKLGGGSRDVVAGEVDDGQVHRGSMHCGWDGLQGSSNIKLKVWSGMLKEWACRWVCVCIFTYAYAYMRI